MKKTLSLSLILVLLLSGQAFAVMTVDENIDWEEAPPLEPWTVLFSTYINDSETYGEIIVVENKKDEAPKLFSTTIYYKKNRKQNEKLFFEAIYNGDQKPTDFIEIINRNDEEHLSAIKKEELEGLVEIIVEDSSWIILHDYILENSF